MGSFGNVLLNQKLKATKSGTPNVVGVFSFLVGLLLAGILLWTS